MRMQLFSIRQLLTVCYDKLEMFYVANYTVVSRT